VSALALAPPEPGGRAERCAHAAELALAAAIGDLGSLHLPGVRDRNRRELARAITCAREALAAASGAALPPALATRARRVLVRANAARAEDARHGAGQLVRGAQRAPTREACDDGWQRVERIVALAEAAAADVAELARTLDEPATARAARAAARSARDARRIVDERNHAYTFHTDPGFSFGEGW
jgi:hypothetical protein